MWRLLSSVFVGSLFTAAAWWLVPVTLMGDIGYIGLAALWLGAVIYAFVKRHRQRPRRGCSWRVVGMTVLAILVGAAVLGIFGVIFYTAGGLTLPKNATNIEAALAGYEGLRTFGTWIAKILAFSVASWLELRGCGPRIQTVTTTT